MAVGTLSQVLVLRVGDGEYAVPIEAVVEVHWMVELTAMPDAPPWLLGMLNLRGLVVPVVDLRLRLGLPTRSPDLSTPIVVINSRGRRLGLVADTVVEVLAVGPEDRLAPDEAVGLAHPIDSLLRVGRRLLLALAPDRLAIDLSAAS